MFTLFASGAQPLSDHPAKSEAMVALDAYAKAHPTLDAYVREDRTSDGTVWVEGGHAYGRIVADFQFGEERHGRRIVHY